MRGGHLAPKELRPKLFVEVNTGTPVVPESGEVGAHFDVLCTPAAVDPCPS